jgi:hypothetical protein
LQIDLVRLDRAVQATRVALGSIDRLLLVGPYRLAPGALDALKIIRPETLIRWHRAGFEPFGAGNPDRAVADRGHRPTFVVSFAR